MDTQSFLKKIRRKGLHGILKSFYMRFYYTFITPWQSMHGDIAKRFWHLFQILPLNKNLILFQSEPDFCDNSWALYQYLLKERSKYRFVWIVKNPQDFINKVNSQTTFATNCGKGLHLKTIYYYATAKYNFYTHWTFQPYIPRKGQTVINLWHGGYPLKATKVKNKDYFNWLISVGEEGKDALIKYLGCSNDKVLVLGQPRIDLLIKNINKGIANPYCPKKEVKKVIIWMPTFRKSVSSQLSEQLCDTDTGLPLLANKDDIIKFNQELKELNVVVIAKIHHLQAQKEFFKTSYSNFIIVTDDMLSADGIQLYEILGKSDALLTDYSTVVWDYLTVNKPMGFILDDIQQYEESCGFNVENVLDLLKGEHIYNYHQLIQFIMHVLDGEDNYERERKKQLELKIQLLPQGGNCKNIVDYFGI